MDRVNKKGSTLKTSFKAQMSNGSQCNGTRKINSEYLLAENCFVNTGDACSVFHSAIFFLGSFRFNFSFSFAF